MRHSRGSIVFSSPATTATPQAGDVALKQDVVPASISYLESETCQRFQSMLYLFLTCEVISFKFDNTGQRPMGPSMMVEHTPQNSTVFAFAIELYDINITDLVLFA